MNRKKLKEGRPEKYELVPTLLKIPMFRTSDTEWQTRATNIAQAQRNSARLSAEIVRIAPDLEKNLKQLEEGDEDAVYRLIELNYSFVNLPQVSKVIDSWRNLHQFKKLGKIKASNKPGRPAEDHRNWLLYFLVESLTREGQSKTEVFEILAKSGFNGNHLSFERIRQIYYQMKNAHDYDPIMLCNEKESTIVSRKEYETWLNGLAKPPASFEFQHEIEGQKMSFLMEFNK